MLGFLAVALTGLLLWATVRSMARPRSFFSSYVRLIASHLQLLTLLASFRFQWPQAVSDFLAIFASVTDAPSQLLSLNCLLSAMASGFPSFYSRVILYVLFLPLTGLALIALAIGCRWPCLKQTRSNHSEGP